MLMVVPGDRAWVASRVLQSGRVLNAFVRDVGFCAPPPGSGLAASHQISDI